MNKRIVALIILVLVACLLWTEMFVLKHFNFWYEMLVSAGFLAMISFYFNHKAGSEINFRLYFFKFSYILIGIVSAGILYVIFYSGNYFSNLLFDFTKSQVNGIYGNKSLLDTTTIGLLLFFIIGPAEEIFWRGFVQDTLSQKYGDNIGWVVAALIYSGVHIFALNYMLFMAALICGLFWGFVFKKYKSLWPGIISHALWDLTIFILLPIV
jgi:membrane protease YdiL (CAAX protease family)